MKMAKASKADLDMAMELCNALDALTQRWSATVPDEIAKPEGEDESEYFSLDDREQCQRVLGYLLEVADRASLMRVVWGCAVMLDPANKCVDASADTLEHHPDIQRYEWLRKNFAALEFSREGNRLHIENGDAPEKLDILLDELRAATEAA